MIPLFDKDANGFIDEDELKTHIGYMQRRYVMNDVDRTWKSHPTDDNKLTWKEYRDSVYGPESTFCIKIVLITVTNSFL